MENIEVHALDIKTQINKYYRQYAIYVIESRGIPNFYDSLTPVQRLILINAPEKFNKTLGLVGAVMQTGLYHHGDMGLSKSIQKLARPFACSERLLIGDGYFGSPINPKAASPRYTSVKISPYIKDKLFEYYDINQKNAEGGYDWLNFDLPLGLATHTVGIAVGYSSNILPRKLSEIKEYLEGKPKQLKPYFMGFNGNIKRHKDNKNGWIIEGVFSYDDSTMTINIGELPPLKKYSSFIESMYAKLGEYGEQCKVDNNSSSTVDITIKWKDKNTWALVRDGIEKLTKLAVIECLIFIKDGCVMEYESISDYLDEFKVHMARVIYNKMIYDLGVSNDELDFLRAKREFLIFMMEKKRKNDEIKTFISKYNKKIQVRLDSIKLTALSPETVRITEDEIKAMEKSIKDQTKTSKEQLEVCKILEKSFVSKGKVNMNKSTPLFDDAPVKLDGIDIYAADEEDKIVSEDETDENNEVD